MSRCFMQLLLLQRRRWNESHSQGDHKGRSYNERTGPRRRAIVGATLVVAPARFLNVPSSGPGYHNCTILCTHPAVLYILYTLYILLLAPYILLTHDLLFVYEYRLDLRCAGEWKQP